MKKVILFLVFLAWVVLAVLSVFSTAWVIMLVFGLFHPISFKVALALSLLLGIVSSAFKSGVSK